jgi:hypothetical protein
MNEVSNAWLIKALGGPHTCVRSSEPALVQIAAIERGVITTTSPVL